MTEETLHKANEIKHQINSLEKRIQRINCFLEELPENSEGGHVSEFTAGRLELSNSEIIEFTTALLENCHRDLDSLHNEFENL